MTTRTRPRGAFDLQVGRTIGGKYVVERKLGAGSEGEVYKIVETRTGVHRAAKLFFPHQNEGDRATTRYARKLDRLRHCPMVIQYHHSETIRIRRVPITCLISEYVEGALVSRFLAEQRGGRLAPFEAGHLLLELVRGLESIHAAGEYHGDVHDDNVMVARRGLGFELKLVDFYHWGPSTAAQRREDVVDAIRLFHDAVGGRVRYAKQPTWVKDVCRGLRRDLLRARFPTTTALRQHLESFSW